MMKFQITSMTPEERLYAYSQSSQIEGQTGCIGYLRGDFGAGQEFYTSWFDRRKEYKEVSSRRSLTKWSTPCGKRMGCFVAGPA